jgi:nitroreductase
MENMWLVADSLGIGFLVVSAMSAPEVAREIKNILDIPEPRQTALACRLGYPAVSQGKYFRVRRNIGDFAHRNRFGAAYQSER